MTEPDVIFGNIGLEAVGLQSKQFENTAFFACAGTEYRFAIAQMNIAIFGHTVKERTPATLQTW
ncbi:hypothetical protein KKE60_06665 [Patescibacteria group bacterium]|nr:hypothetical protein [Patescibacteria group bacterium]